MNWKNSMVTGTALGTVLALGFTPSALAQSQSSTQAPEASEADTGGPGVIVVTARRREEPLQSVPIAVTALNAEGLKEANVTRMENLGNVVPSLTIAPTQGRANAPAFAIRGQRQDAGYMTNDSSVGIYFAEAVQARSFGLAQSLFDLESVQVLKGPQGTLFGRSTTGGAILFQPTRPELGDLSGYAQVRYGNFDRFDLQGAVSLPVGESVAIRLAGNRTRMSGYVKDRTSGKNFNAEHTDSVRGTILFEPSQKFSNTLYVDYFKADARGTAGRTVAVNPNGFAQRFLGLGDVMDQQNATFGFYEVETNLIPRSAGSNFGLTNVSEGQMSDNLELKTILNYRRIRSTEEQDFDGTPLRALDTRVTQGSDQFTGEIQLLGTTSDDKFQYIIGGFYFTEDGFLHTDVVALGGAPTKTDASATNTAYAVFAQGDYKLMDNLTLTLGVRMNWDKREFTTARYNSAGVCTLCASDEATFDAPTYTASLSWQIDPKKLLYVTTRRGYRSGGFNSSANTLTAITPFKPEYVTDYEIGFKGDWTLGGDASLRTNLAVFQTNYTDIQRNILTLVGGSPTNSVFNAASARIRGSELEVQFFPVRHVELFASGSWMDPEYKSFIYTSASGALVDETDNTFAFVPKWTYRLGANVKVPVGDESKLTASINYFWRSKVYFSEFNDEVSSQDAYGLLNGRIGVSDIGGTNLSLALWGRNLTDKKYYVASGNQYTTLGTVTNQLSEPRTYGIEASFEF